MKRKVLSNIRLNFLSAVDSPAAQHSNVILMKRHEKAAPMDYKTFAAMRLKAGDTPAEAAAAWKKLPANMKKAQPDVGDVAIPKVVLVVVAGAAKVGKFARVLAKARGAVPPAFATVVKDAVAFNDVVENEETIELMQLLQQTLWSIVCDDSSDATAKEGLIFQALKDFYAALTAPDSEADDTTITKEQDMTPEETQALVDSAISKAIPLAVAPLQADLAKAATANTELVAKLATAEAAVATLTKLDARRALIAKAQAIVTESGAVMKAEDVADLLEGADEAHQEKIIGLVKQNGALAAEGQIFKAFGTAGEASNTDANTKVETLAVAKRTATPTLTIEQARAAVYEEHPELYEDATAL